MTSVNFGSISTQVQSYKVVLVWQQKQCVQLQHVKYNTAREIWKMARQSPLKNVLPDADDSTDDWRAINIQTFLDNMTIFVTNKNDDTFLYLNSNKILSSLAVTFNIGVLKLCIHRRTLQQKYFSFGSIN